MRICLVYSGSSDKRIESFSKALMKGLETQGSHIIDLIDIDKDSDKKLTGYQYILFGCGKKTLFSTKVPESMVRFVKNCGHIAGKHVFAYTVKSVLAPKFLLNLMSLLESEGVFMKNSTILSSETEAKINGSKLHLK